MVELTLDTGIAYSSLLCMALLPIYIGSHNSLKQKATESMTTKDAYIFPFIGSGVLFGLYILFKLFHKDYINLLLSSYFLLFGIFALATTLRPIFVMLFPRLVRTKNPRNISFPQFWYFWSSTPRERVDIKFDDVDVISTLFSTLVGVWYIMHKHWVANNVLGLAFSIQGISMLSLGSYKVGCILLSGLFFYDIFWVFGTEVMVTVAKSFDAPVKLLFPKSLFADELQFSMLGLGDIVIPGIFIALLLRFDAKHSQKAKKAFKKTYFSTTFIAYVLGLATTIFVMHTFQAAQPALLYLVPFCIGASLVTALVNSQLTLLFAYSEEPPAEEGKKTDGEEKKKTLAEKKEKKEKQEKQPVAEKEKKVVEKEKGGRNPSPMTKNNSNNNNNNATVASDAAEQKKKPKKQVKPEKK